MITTYPILNTHGVRILLLGFPAPATIRCGDAAYIHRWWRFERGYRVIELDVEFGSPAYRSAVRDHGITCVFLASAPVTRAAFFRALEEYRRRPPKLWRPPSAAAHRAHVRATARPLA